MVPLYVAWTVCGEQAPSRAPARLTTVNEQGRRARGRLPSREAGPRAVLAILLFHQLPSITSHTSAPTFGWFFFLPLLLSFPPLLSTKCHAHLSHGTLTRGFPNSRNMEAWLATSSSASLGSEQGWDVMRKGLTHPRSASRSDGGQAIGRDPCPICPQSPVKRRWG